MQEPKNAISSRASVTKKTAGAQDGLSGFFKRIFGLQDGWHLQRDIGKNNYELGLMQFREGRYHDAIFRLRIACWADAKHAPSWYWLGRSYLAEGKRPQALEAFKKAAALKPDDEHTRYMMALAYGKNIPTGAQPQHVPMALVKEHFGMIAADYNQLVAERLNTEAQQVAQAARAALYEGRVDHVILDLGAGTGLCGAQLYDVAAHLTGVDVSEPMLRQARLLQSDQGKKLYSVLIHKDALEFLRGVDDASFDVVLASGLVHTLGELQSLFEVVSRCLKPGGVFVFNTYACDDAYRFDASLEAFAYGRDYLQQCAQNAGLSADVDEASFIPAQKGWIGVCRK